MDMGFFRIYYQIILPMLKPILATIALLSFRQGWNEYILLFVFTMTNDKLRPLTVGVNKECWRRYCSMEYHVCRCDNFNCPDFDCLLLL